MEHCEPTTTEVRCYVDLAGVRCSGFWRRFVEKRNVAKAATQTTKRRKRTFCCQQPSVGSNLLIFAFCVLFRGFGHSRMFCVMLLFTQECLFQRVERSYESRNSYLLMRLSLGEVRVGDLGLSDTVRRRSAFLWVARCTRKG